MENLSKKWQKKNVIIVFFYKYFSLFCRIFIIHLYRFVKSFFSFLVQSLKFSYTLKRKNKIKSLETFLVKNIFFSRLLYVLCACLVYKLYYYYFFFFVWIYKFKCKMLYRLCANYRIQFLLLIKLQFFFWFCFYYCKIIKWKIYSFLFRNT